MIGVIQESDDLPAGAVCTGAELAIARTARDVVLRCPRNGICKVRTGRYITEAAAAHRRRTGCPVQETVWARFTVAFGAKVSALVPLVMPFSTAHRTAS